MRKLFLLAVMACLAAAPTFAQTTGDDYHRVEGFFGYSHNRVDVGPVEDFDPDDDTEFSDIFDEREGYNGFNASVTGNVTRMVGLKFDYSYHQRSIEFGTDNVTARLHNVLGGVQLKNNSREARLKPFAHVLAGVGHYSVDLTEFDDELDNFDDAGFSMAVGGGLDVRVHPRIDIRAFQFDYNPTRFDFQDFGAPGGTPGTPTNTGDQRRTLHNFRIGIGIVFH
jgi:opacity protein-like surface antigen